MKAISLLAAVCLVLSAACPVVADMIYTSATVDGQNDSGNKPLSQATHDYGDVTGAAYAAVEGFSLSGMSALNWDSFDYGRPGSASTQSRQTLQFEVLSAGQPISFDWHIDGLLQMVLDDPQGLSAGPVTLTAAYGLQIYDGTSGDLEIASYWFTRDASGTYTQPVSNAGTYDFDGTTYEAGTLIDVTLDLGTSVSSYSHYYPGYYYYYPGYYYYGLDYYYGWGSGSYTSSCFYPDASTVDTFVNLRLIPEPAMLILLGVAGVAIAIGRRVKC